MMAAALSALLLSSCTRQESGVQKIPLDRFQFTARGNYQSRPDERELIGIIQPLAVAKKGDHGVISTRLTLPSAAKPPYLVSFYVSDNNEASGMKAPPPITARSGPISVIIDERTGHRFQKCWINDTEVWKRDTIEANQSKPFTLDITRYVIPGEPFEVRFGMEEAVDSHERLPEDRFIGSNSLQPGHHEKMDFAKYETRSYWGDFTLHWGGAEPPSGQETAWLKPLQLPHLGGEPVRKVRSVSLEVEKRELMGSRWAWPVSMGVPFPKGVLREPSLTLQGSDGTMRTNATPMNRWPDGSIRWARLQFTLPPGMTDEALTLSVATDGDTVPGHGAVSTERNEGKELMINGQLQVELESGGEAAFRVRNSQGVMLINGLEVFAVSGSEPARVRWQSVEVEETSAWQVKRALHGVLLDPKGRELAQMRFAVDLYADVPYVHTRLTMISQAPGGLALEQYGYRFRTIGTPNSQFAKEGWVSGAGTAGSWIAVVKNFKHLWPNELSAGGDGMTLHCFKPGDKRLPLLKLARGEALGSEIWFAAADKPIAPQEAAVFAQMVATPPRLNSSVMIRESKVWGGMIALTPEHPMYARYIEGHLAGHYAGAEEGLRWFGNYQGGISENYYWNSIQSMYALYAMTGERRWMDWADRSAENMMDHLVNHLPQDGHEPGGVRYWLDPDKPLKFDVKTQSCSGLFYFWAMHGDRRAWKAGKEMADFLAQDKGMRQGIHWKSARFQGWPLIFLMGAYQETHDPRYLEASQAAMRTAMSCMDLRRGAYIEHHGNPSFKGMIPFMDAILMSGLREVHLQTDNAEAAKLLAMIAWATHAEMGSPTKAGYYDYSPDPYKRFPLATLNPGITAAMAYAAVLTQDPRLAVIAQESWDAFLKEKPQEKKTFAFCYDLPAALYWLAEAEKLAKTNSPEHQRGR